MSVEENKASVRRVYEEVWNKGNMEVVPELVSPDYYFKNVQGEFKGHEGYMQMVKSIRDAFPDVHYTVDDVMGEGDWVTTQLTMAGTFTGKFGDIEPTGKKFSIKQIVITRYVDGKSAEARTLLDALSLYQQLGITPPTG